MEETEAETIGTEPRKVLIEETGTETINWMRWNLWKKLGMD